MKRLLFVMTLALASVAFAEDVAATNVVSAPVEVEAKKPPRKKPLRQIRPRETRLERDARLLGVSTNEVSAMDAKTRREKLKAANEAKRLALDEKTAKRLGITVEEVRARREAKAAERRKRREELRRERAAAIEKAKAEDAAKAAKSAASVTNNVETAK